MHGVPLESGSRIASGDRHKIMGLATIEFILRVLIRALPDGFRRTWHAARKFDPQDHHHTDPRLPS